jgi:hypothetical protein
MKKKTKKTISSEKKNPVSKRMPDHIDEYFTKIEGSKEQFNSRELFKADEESIDLKTHLTDEEISLLNVLSFNDALLKSRGLKPIFSKFTYKYMRLKVSKDRLSRQEFVGINKVDKSEEINTNGSLKNMVEPRK